jgi:hypothetical protein
MPIPEVCPMCGQDLGPRGLAYHFRDGDCSPVPEVSRAMAPQSDERDTKS